MIYVGIDDTDILGSPGTNQLAREIVRRAADRWTCCSIVRHQLLHDPRIPFTSKNGSASIVLESKNGGSPSDLTELCRQAMRDWFIYGSDPGLCVTETVSDAVTDFGRQCQQQVTTQEQARELARQSGISLEGLGGTEGGVIGALAAVGLAATKDDGRIVQWRTWPDDLSGVQPIVGLKSRDIAVREEGHEIDLLDGTVNVGRHLRPNLRGGRAVLFVQRDPGASDASFYTAMKLP